MRDRTVLKYYVFEATRNAHLSGPIWVLFLLSRDISYSGIGLLDAVFSLTVLVAETPTGYVGDRIGRRRALVIGTLGGSLGSLAFAFAGSLSGFLFAYVTLAIARTFTSGSDSAWLYDTLRARTDESRFADIRGRGKSLGLVVSAVAAVAGGLLGSVNLAWPWVVSGVLTAAGVPVVLSFPTPDEAADGAEVGEAHPDPGPLDALRAVRDRLLGPHLRWFVVYTGVFAAVMGVVNFFIQPVTVDAVPELPPVFDVQLDGVVVVGLVFAAFRLVAAVVTARAGWIRERVGIESWFRGVPVALGGLFAGVALLPVAAIPMFFVLRAVRSVTEPLQGQYLNDHINSVGRATTLSAVAMLHSLLVAPFELAGGALADAVGEIPAISLLGGFLVVAAVGIQLVGVFERQGSERPTATE